MYLKHVFGWMIVILLAGSSYGQVVNTEKLNSYPLSVLVKVNDIASQISLNDTEQVALAELFTDEEQQLSNLILNGANKSSIDSLKLIYKYQFNELLSANKTNDYYTAIAQKIAIIKANAIVKLINAKYTPMPSVLNYIYDVIYWRETQIEKNMLINNDTILQAKNLYVIDSTYDSLYEKYINAAKATSYLNNKLQILDSIMPLEEKQKNGLINLFNNLCLTNTQNNYGDNFKNAFYSIFTDIKDTVYYMGLFKDEINRASMLNTTEAIYYYIQSNNLSTEGIGKLSPLILEREKDMVSVSYMYISENTYKDSLLQLIMTKYQPYINEILASDGSLQNSSQIAISLKMKDNLGLNDDQIEQLSIALNQLDKDIEEFKLKNDNTEYDSKEYESKVLNKVLQPQQYTKILIIKFYYKAFLNSSMDSTEIVKYGLDNNFDMNKVGKELFNYHLSLLTAFYRNANDREKQIASLKSIAEIMPECLKLLNDKREIKTPYGNEEDTFFQW